MIVVIMGAIKFWKFRQTLFQNQLGGFSKEQITTHLSLHFNKLLFTLQN